MTITADPQQIDIRRLSGARSAGPDPAFLDGLGRRVVAGSDASFPVLSPVNGGRLGDVPQSAPADVEHAYALARRAQRSWRDVPVKQRCEIVLRFHDLLLDRRDEILDLVQWETGKARKDAMEELIDVCLNSRHYARTAPRLLRSRAVRGALPGLVSARQHTHPKGVVGIISPWNYPLTLAVSDGLPALLAGNAVVLKPDSQSTLTALWVVDLLYSAGLPEDLLQVVAGPGTTLGPAIVAGADYLMFTGSTRVGRLLASQCGERLIGCSLELGGKNAMIVCADADVQRSVEIAVRASFSNSGQLCESMERIYVARDIWDSFVPEFVAGTANLRQSVDIGWGADVGSLISQQQLDSVSAHVADAVARGATLLTGGQPRPDVGPFAYSPTILTDVVEGMTLCREETFGPVVSLYPFDDEDEAVEMANDTAYGLNGAVLTRDTTRGRAIAVRLQAGTINVNEGYAAAWGSLAGPLGGMGDSGLGRRHGVEGLLKYTEPQTVAVQHLLGWGPQFGMSHEQWGNTLALGIKAMKTLRMK